MTEDTLKDYRERMTRVLVHIDKHLDEPVSLDELARIACFSSFHFHRVFCGMVGETVKAYIRRLRLERAASLLIYGALPVTRIAFQAGYETVESFSRAFCAQFGEPPSRYRSRRRPSHESAGNEHDYAFLYSGEKSKMEVTLKKMPRRKVAFVRNTGPYAQCGVAWDRLCAWAGPRGLLGPGASFIGICHDDPEVTAPENIRYDASITVGEDIEGEGGIGTQYIPEGEYAVVLHRGPFENLHQTYAELMGRWMPEHGREMKPQASLEVYLNPPDSTPPEELLTEVQVALLPR
ncbi:AraC family transcriptional regulator [bacterium]|nr:AraC family transcriptional regulator [bacterium]